MSLAASMRETARTLIARFGGPAIVTRVAGTYDASTDTWTDASTPVPVTAVAQPAGRGAEVRVGSLVGRRINEFIVAGPLAIEVKDTIAWAGRTWTVVAVTSTDPDGSGAIITQAYAEA